jgi:hypothetical protein
MNYFREPLDDVQQLTTFSSDVDLTDSTSYPVAARRGHARWIRVEDVTSGTTLEVVLTGSGGTKRSLTVSAGDEFDGKFVTVGDNTSVDLISVGW